MVSNKSIGEKLIQLRGDRSIAEVSRSLKLTNQALWNYENNIRVPRDDIKKKIADYYKVDVGKLFF